MSKKSLSQKRALRQQQERAALNNIFNVFLLGLAAECYLFIVYRGYVGGSVNSLLLWDKILHVITWVGLALAAAGAAVAVWKRKDAKLCKVAGISALAGLFLGVSGLVMTNFFDVGVVTMCIAVPVLTVLGLIFFLYQHECFLNTLLLTGSLFTVWVCGRGLESYLGTLVAVCAIAVLIGLVLVILGVSRLQKNGGKFRETRIFSADCDYRLVYAVCAICAAVILTILFASNLSFYLVWALVVILFAELAYYTTKMM